MKKWLAICLLWVVLLLPWQGQAETWRDSLQHQVHQWASELAKQDPRFSPFEEASFLYEALGPNSRSWLVTFSNRHQKIGYMVIQEAPNGFALLEYGLGEFSLFDSSALSSSPSTPRAKHYAGLESVWIEAGTTFYDAKTGERYPKGANFSPIEVSTSVSSSATLLTAFRSLPLSEAEPWIRPGQSIRDEIHLMKQLKEGDVSFIARLFQNTVMAPFKVVGFHQWEEQLFVELEDDGSRYIPYPYAVELGGFFQ